MRATKTTKPKKLRDVLKTRKDWCQGTWMNSKGQCCLLGAVSQVDPNNTRNLQGKLLGAIKKLFPRRAYKYGIPGFNDSRHTTFRDVCRVIKLAGV